MTYELSRHNLPHLFKYTSVETAQKVISTQSFRWSSPLNFNDPFDHQTGFAFKFTGTELGSALEFIAESAIFGLAPFNPPYKTTYGEALRQMRAISSKLPRAEVMSQIRDGSVQIADDFPLHCDKLNEEIISSLTHSRVLCLSETGDNVVMWSHYADKHRGVVFKLRRLEEMDHRFLIARKVTYTDEALPFLALDDYVDNLVGIKAHDVSSQAWDIAYRKHTDWAYEREWRVHIPLLNQPAGDGLSDYDEPKELFEAVYLGCCINLEMAAAIVQLVHKHLPDTQIYQARKGREHFRLESDRIK